MPNQGPGAGLDPATNTTDARDAPPVGRIVLVAATAALGGFLFGFDTAVINGAVGAIREWSHVDAALLGFSVASALLGSAEAVPCRNSPSFPSIDSVYAAMQHWRSRQGGLPHWMRGEIANAI